MIHFNKKTLLVLLFSLLLQNSLFAKEFDLDVIDLQHRTAEEITPLIQPFLNKDAAVTARGYKLIIKSTSENLAEIRKLIEQLDTQLRQLMITVSIGRFEEEAADKKDVEINAEIKSGDVTSQAEISPAPEDNDNTSGSIIRLEKKSDKTKIVAKAQTKKTTTHREKPVLQTIRTLEGQWATIRTGQAIPIVQRTQNPDGTVTQTIKYHSATTGFSVLPRLQPDNRVLLYIRPSQTTPSQEGGGKFDIQSIESTIDGKLGEWVALGGMDELSRTSNKSIIHSTRSRKERYDDVFVKIELIQ